MSPGPENSGRRDTGRGDGGRRDTGRRDNEALGGAGGALERLVQVGPERPWVTYGFLGLCWLVTMPTLFRPELYDVLGGLAPRRHPWQPLTAPLEHGWPGFHGSIHLVLNTFLIWECGRPCERLLGRGRFILLTLLAWVANAAVIRATEGVNGSSLVIWAWGPPLAVALGWARGRGIHGHAATDRLRGILILMYGIIVVVMVFLAYASGFRGSPLVALVRGNLYHGVATGVGLVFTLFAASTIRRRLNQWAGKGT